MNLYIYAGEFQLNISSVPNTTVKQSSFNTQEKILD